MLAMRALPEPWLIITRGHAGSLTQKRPAATELGRALSRDAQEYVAVMV